MNETMPAELTQANFNRLPLLLRLKELEHWGVPRTMVPELIASGRLTFVEAKTRRSHQGGSRRHYHKSSLARIVGLKA
jgi:hypothetical protein